jgi:hypothetical protein
MTGVVQEPPRAVGVQVIQQPLEQLNQGQHRPPHLHHLHHLRSPPRGIPIAGANQRFDILLQKRWEESRPGHPP